MKLLKDTLDVQTKTLATESKFYRFQLFVKDNGAENSVGMAYLKEGTKTYTLRLWTFLDIKFYLLPTQDDPTKYLIMTRELKNIKNSKNKYFWNIVGHGKARSMDGVLELNFDLLSKTIFMNLFPEPTATPYGLPVPDGVDQAA